VPLYRDSGEHDRICERRSCHPYGRDVDRLFVGCGRGRVVDYAAPEHGQHAIRIGSRDGFREHRIRADRPCDDRSSLRRNFTGCGACVSACSGPTDAGAVAATHATSADAARAVYLRDYALECERRVERRYRIHSGQRRIGLRVDRRRVRRVDHGHVRCVRHGEWNGRVSSRGEHRRRAQRIDHRRRQDVYDRAGRGTCAVYVFDRRGGRQLH
jgi:hypothetical protein